MRTRLVGLLLSVLLAKSAIAGTASRVVLDATPTIRIDSDSSSARRTVLSRSGQLEARLLIVASEGRYYWATRENRELQLVSSGIAAYYFIDPLGGGYVKIVTPGSYSGRSARAPVQFYEHVSLGMGTTTYFGTAATFTLSNH